MGAVAFTSCRWLEAWGIGGAGAGVLVAVVAAAAANVKVLLVPTLGRDREGVPTGFLGKGGKEPLGVGVAAGVDPVDFLAGGLSGECIASDGRLGRRLSVSSISISSMSSTTEVVGLRGGAEEARGSAIEAMGVEYVCL